MSFFNKYYVTLQHYNTIFTKSTLKNCFVTYSSHILTIYDNLTYTSILLGFTKYYYSSTSSSSSSSINNLYINTFVSYS